MKKRISGRKLSRTTNERKQLFRNLVRAMVERGHLVTSRTKAKTVKPSLEKLVTMAKHDSLTTIRRLVTATGDAAIAKKLIQLGTLFKARPGGYTRIIPLTNQAGDNTLMARLEWVEKMAVPENIKLSDKKAAKVVTPQKSEVKTDTREKSITKKS